MISRNLTRLLAIGLGLTAVALSPACRSSAPTTGKVTPIYSAKTGKLEELTLDRNGDGRVDTWALMDGVHLQSIQIDRHGTGKPDRWEYYAEGTPPAGSPPSAGSAFDRKTVIVRAEEANGPDRTTVTRREFYTDGVIARVEEDTDFDGRVDKWETYDHGVLTRMDLDISGRGRPDRRLVYRPDGSFDHVEVDVKGDGHFVPVPPGSDQAPPSSASPPKKSIGGTT
jgi:hypothetical protein